MIDLEQHEAPADEQVSKRRHEEKKVKMQEFNLDGSWGIQRADSIQSLQRSSKITYAWAWPEKEYSRLIGAETILVTIHAFVFRPDVC